MCNNAQNSCIHVLSPHFFFFLEPVTENFVFSFWVVDIFLWELLQLLCFDNYELSTQHHLRSLHPIRWIFQPKGLHHIAIGLNRNCLIITNTKQNMKGTSLSLEYVNQIIANSPSLANILKLMSRCVMMHSNMNLPPDSKESHKPWIVWRRTPVPRLTVGVGDFSEKHVDRWKRNDMWAGNCDIFAGYYNMLVGYYDMWAGYYDMFARYFNM